MAYACDAATPCVRRPVFSTPNRNFPETTTTAGTATDDTTRAMELTSVQAANFRDTACTYSVNQTSIAVPYNGATGSIIMTTATGCAWNAVTSDSSVATFPGGSYSGGGSLSYTVSANPSSSPRTVTLTMGGRPISVTQDGNNCTYSLGASSATVSSAAGSHSVAVNAPSGCSWTAGVQAAGSQLSFPAVQSSLGPIPDSPFPGPQAPGTPLEIIFNVSGTSGFSQIELSMMAMHTYVGDIEATLIAPNGVSHRIFGYTGATTSTGFGSASDMNGTYVFKDSASSPPSGGWWQAAAANAVIPSGDYRTTNSGGAGATSPMPATSINTSFASLTDLNGEWTLRVTDGGSGDTGSVTSAVLRITPAAPSWLALQTTSGSGSANVSYTVTQNTTGASRSATITAAGQDFVVTQSAPASSVSVGGSVTYFGGSNPSVPSVTLSLSGGSSGTALSDAGGQYTISGISSGSSGTLTPSKSGSVAGIASADASRVAQYSAGLITLTANQLIAADASGNGTVSSLDASRIAQYIVGLNPLGATGTWKFSPASRSFSSLTSSATGENFTAILVGDVTGNWSATALSEGDEPSALLDSVLEKDLAAFPLAIMRRSAVSGDIVTIPVTVGDVTNRGVTSFDLVLSFDPEVLEPVMERPVDNMGTLSANFAVVPNPNVPGRLVVSAYSVAPMVGEGALINLVFRVKGGDGASTPLRFEKVLLNEDAVKVPDGRFTVGRDRREAVPTFRRRDR
jgi:subtilisin-like proprotein convertase family protein